MSRPPIPLAERFWTHVDASGDCWIWTGSSRYGYGSVRGEHMGSKTGRTRLAHRAAYELLVGPIPPGLELDHLCRNPGCVNPDHLEPVPGLVNNRRSESGSARRGRQTHCKNGHEFTPENTYIRRAGWRNCRACSRSYDRSHDRIRHYHRGNGYAHDTGEIKQLAAFERGEKIDWTIR